MVLVVVLMSRCADVRAVQCRLVPRADKSDFGCISEARDAALSTRIFFSRQQNTHLPDTTISHLHAPYPTSIKSSHYEAQSAQCADHERNELTGTKLDGARSLSVNLKPDLLQTMSRQIKSTSWPQDMLLP
jgi:hypothetical protein